MPTFEKDGRTVTTDVPVQVVQLRAEGWRQVSEPAAPSVPEAADEQDMPAAHSRRRHRNTDDES